MREFSLVDADDFGFIGYKEDGSKVRAVPCKNFRNLEIDCHKFTEEGNEFCVACRCDCKPSPEFRQKITEMLRFR